MSQSKEKRTSKRSVEQAPSSTVVDRDRKGRRTGLIIVSVFILIIVSIIWFFTYQGDAPYRHTIIIVDDITIRMDYFLKRTQLSGSAPMTMLRNLTEEQIIKLAAPRYGIEASPEDIDQELRRIARGGSETIAEDEFKEWYRQLLNETGLSDSEYKDIVAIGLLRVRLHEYLAERMPTVAEQVHLYSIFVETYEDAEKVRARWEAGEDFADLTREVSLDEQTRQKGGELGWFPRGVLDSRFEYEAFNLSTGNVSQPLPLMDEASSVEDEPTIVGFYLLMVSEKVDAREVDEEYLPALRSRVLEGWFSEEWKLHEVRYYGFNNGFDSETQAWISWQLSKK